MSSGLKNKSQAPILVTGAAGFIGAKTVELLLADGHTVVGIDNLNDYYDVRLKNYRLNTLLGQAEMHHKAKTAYKDAGATVVDSLDGTLTGELSITSTVNTDAIGEYSVMFSVKDKAGNLAEAVRIVHITDTTPPNITLLGQAEMIIEAGQPFQDPGVLAEDELDRNRLCGKILPEPNG